MRYRTIGSWADFETQVNDVLHPGSSISVEGQEAAGCFSGLVKLTWDDERSKVYGLTSHHLVSVGRADKTAPIRPGDGDPVTIVSPAEKDREFVLAELKRTLGYRDEDVAREEQWKRECGPEKPWDEKSEASLERRRKSAALLREELETLQPLWEEAPYLGKVAWSSGIQDSKGHAMADWALMEIDRERVPVIGSEFEPVSAYYPIPPKRTVIPLTCLDMHSLTNVVVTRGGRAGVCSLLTMSMHRSTRNHGGGTHGTS